MSEPEEDWYYPDDDQDDCITCGGEGYVNGEDIASQYDYGWIDENKTYKCPNCGGSGNAADMTYC